MMRLLAILSTLAVTSNALSPTTNHRVAFVTPKAPPSTAMAASSLAVETSVTESHLTSSSSAVLSSAAQQQQSSSPAFLHSSDLPAWVNLPASSATIDAATTKDLQNMELIIGRVAMIGAVGLLGKEIMTGESFADQLSTTMTALFHLV